MNLEGRKSCGEECDVQDAAFMAFQLIYLYVLASVFLILDLHRKVSVQPYHASALIS